MVRLFWSSFMCSVLTCTSAPGSIGGSRIKYRIPTRGLLGIRTAMLTATKGTAVLNTNFLEYDSWCGDISTRELGSLVCMETGPVRPAHPLLPLPTLSCSSHGFWTVSHFAMHSGSVWKVIGPMSQKAGSHWVAQVSSNCQIPDPQYCWRRRGPHH